MVPVELTVEVVASRLSDGTEVFTASVAEMPGIVAEGPNEDAAVTELLAVINNLHERVGSEVVGLRTREVAGWSWTMGGGDEVRTWGAVARPDALPAIA